MSVTLHNGSETLSHFAVLKSSILFRYGEHRQNILNLVIHLKPRTTTTSSPSSSSSQGTAVEATGDPTASALTPNTYLNAVGSIRATNTSAIQNSTTTAVNILSEKEEYERKFFLLRVFVLGTIGCVFSTLTLMFWIYFMYLWRTWDAGKRDSGSVSVQPNEDLEIQRVSFCSGAVFFFSLQRKMCICKNMSERKKTRKACHTLFYPLI